MFDDIQVTDQEPPRLVQHSNYGKLWEAMDKLPEGKWLKFTVTYTKETKATVIHSARRAGQRWFEKHVDLRLVSRVVPVDEYSSTMWFQKAKK